MQKKDFQFLDEFSLKSIINKNIFISSSSLCIDIAVDTFGFQMTIIMNG